MEKQYPPTVTLRKGIAGVAIIFIFVVVGIVFYNIYNSSQQRQQQQHEHTISTSKTTASTDAVANNMWYDNQVINKTNATIKKIADTTLTTATNTSNAQQVAQTSATAVTTENNSAASQQQKNQNAMQSAESQAELQAELKKVMYAAINTNQIIGDASKSANDNNTNTKGRSEVTDLFSMQQQQMSNSSMQHESSSQSSLSTAALQQQQQSQQLAEDQNWQLAKKDFVKNSTESDGIYLHEALKNPRNIYEVKAGTIIPAILLTGINSDLPGQITAQVRANVYDTIAGKYVLIPQGAKLTGLYDSQVAYGQERVLIVWKRIIFPNGQSINLEGMPGVDMTGYAGFHDQVNNHYMKIFGAVILMSVVSAGAQLSQPQQQLNNNTQLSVNQTLAASLGTNIMNATNMVMQKNIGIQPTLVIRPGYLFNISVTKDIVFPGAYNENINSITVIQ